MTQKRADTKFFSLRTEWLTSEAAIYLLNAMEIDLKYWDEWRETALLKPNSQGLFARTDILKLILKVT